MRLLLTVLLLAAVQTFAQKTTSSVIFGKTVSKKSSDGHIRCATTEYEFSLQQKNPKRATTEQFENWLSDEMEEAKAQRTQIGNVANGTNTIVYIPVVVHVIHNGDAKGTNENISDEQVLSQITVLNQDYRRMSGTPGYNTNNVGADMEIQFVMAQRTPSGDETNGIDRVNLGQASWAESAIESTLKPQTIWDPTQYMNIWVCNFGGDLADVLGYAQFPSSSGLGGLDTNGGAANTDGVIIGYKYFGSSTIFPGGTYEFGYDKGRTTTHEVGHFFGLRHIWGDTSSCTVNATDSNKDYCPDTPAASAANYECVTTNSCTASPGNDMIENYMDYTPDSCMNIFTINQKGRVQTVIANSPRRASLITSLGGTPPQTYALDGKVEIVSLNVACGTSFAPSLSLQNKGTTAITSAQISYTIDNGTAQVYNWTGSLAGGASADITLDALTAATGSHTFNLTLSAINGANDDNTANNTRSEAFSIVNSYQTSQVVLTLQRDKYGSEITWNFKDAAGTVLYSGGPYTDTNSLPALITQTFTVAANQCYTFTINDDYGDGICCTSGAGYFNLKAGTTVIASGASYATGMSSKFGVTSTLGIDEAAQSFNAIFVYPNPASSQLTISVPDAAGLPDSYVVYNSLGQELKTAKVLSESNLNLNISVFATGVYFIKISKDGQHKTLRFVKK